MPNYDAVVIGAGNGGLTSALTLAKNGLKVLLLERHNVPGGCATSFVRGRFEFEVALHQLSGVGTEDKPGPLRGLLAELGVLDKIELVEMKNLYRLVIPDEFDLTLKADRYGVIEALKEKFPPNGQAIERFFELLYSFCTEWVGVVFLGDPKSSPQKYPLYFKYALKPSQAILDDFFDDPLLKSAVSSYWSYLGLPPRLLPFGDLALLLWAYIEFKPFHIKGGSQALSTAILDAFFQAGGDARFNCAARKIIISGGQVKGVLTDEGEELTCRWIVSNASTLSTYLEMIEPEYVPGDQLKVLGAKTIGPSAFTVFLGFNCEPGDVGIKQTTNFISTEWNADKVYARLRTLGNPGAAAFSCYDVSDPDFSPPGTSQAALMTIQYAEPWLSVPPNQYAETKYRYAQGLLNLAEQVFPDLRAHIEEVEVATPLTHMRYLGHPGGAIYGFDQYAKDSDLFNGRRSPIDGLFFAGSWAGMGGFQPTLSSGVLAAKEILRSLGRG